jgi:hypothetical protein
VLCVALVVACTDDKAPAARPGGSASASVASGSDATLARSMARVLADGFQEGAPGRITPAQGDCLVNEIASRVQRQTLTDIASQQPDPKTLPADVRASFAAAFDRCLSRDVATQLRKQFGL